MGEVVFNVNPSVGASLQEQVDSLPVSVRAFYLKLKRGRAEGGRRVGA